MLHRTFPETVRTGSALRDVVGDWRRAGDLVAVVPTMGALHEGHLSLVRAARRRARRVVATIFLNPKQFAANEDLGAYPRNEAQDVAMLGSAGCDLVFAPPVESMYPEGFSTTVSVSGATEALCGAHRPGHFDGVTTVVCKLLNLAQADFAVFGEKDWQQLVTIRRMVSDLEIPVRIVSAPIIREKDGLAMSSRNAYLGDSQRKIAARLNRVLFAAAEHIATGAPVSNVLEAGNLALLEAGFDSVDYLEARNATSLESLEEFDPSFEARLFAAVRLGRTRLIDNVAIERTGKIA